MIRSNVLPKALEESLVRISAWLPLPRRRLPRGEPYRVLACKTCCLGDAIISLYALREYRRLHPHAEIDMLVSDRVADVFKSTRWNIRIFSVPVTGNNLLREIASPGLWIALGRLLLRLRQRSYSEIIDLEVHHGYPALLRAVLGVPRSRGFYPDRTRPHPHDILVRRPADRPEWKCYFDLLAIPIPPSPPAPLFPACPAPTSRIGLVFGASFNWPQKKWPADHFAALASILAKSGYEVVLLSAPWERPDALRIAGLAGEAVKEVCDTPGFEALRDAVQSCLAVVGNDTGTLHLAAACGVTTLTLFGPTSDLKWNPLTSVALTAPGIACRPCYYLSRMPECSHRTCLTALQPRSVADALLARLRAMPFRPADG